MPTAEEKTNFGYEHSVYDLQRTENATNAIRANAKWQLGFLAAFALGLASFTFRDLGELPIIHQGLDEAALFIKLFASFLLILYSLLLMVFIPLLLWGAKVDDEYANSTVLSKEQETKIIKGRTKQCAKKLCILDRNFKRLIILSIISPLVAAALAAYFTYLV